MTKHGRAAEAVLPDRSRADGQQYQQQDTMVDAVGMPSHTAHPFPARSEQPGAAIYHFGNSQYINHDFPQAMSPELQFTADPSAMYVEQDEHNLLATWMSGQIAESGDVFDQDFYQVQEDFFQNNTVDSSSATWSRHGSYDTAESARGGFAFHHSDSIPPSTSVQHAAHAPPVDSDAKLFEQQGRTSQRGFRPLRPRDGTQVWMQAPPDTPHVDETNTRGRKRALSPEARAAARRVRSMRACGRCHALKAKCDTERPCGPCKGLNKRSLDFPCMPELPQDRWCHLFTEELFGHLDLKSRAVIEKMPKPLRDGLNQPFVLRLYQYFDDPVLTIPVVRFAPQNELDVEKSVFPIATNGTTLEVKPTQILSPPLVPAINGQSFPVWTERFRATIRKWLQFAETYKDIGWHRTFFREEHGKPWARSVLQSVCQYFHQVEWNTCPALKSSLQSTIFTYMLGHSFYVPEEDLKDVLGRTGLGSHYTGDFFFVSPIHVDRFIKSMLYPFFRASFARSLNELQKLMAPPRHSKYARDQILATSIVMLIIVGTQQSKAVEKAMALRRRGQEAHWDVVRESICEIEDWIVDNIIEIWKYKFSGEVKWATDEPQDRSPAFRAKIFGLFEKFQASYHTHITVLAPLNVDVPDEIKERQFGTTNVERVLKKFYMAVFPDHFAPRRTDGDGKGVLNGQ